MPLVHATTGKGLHAAPPHVPAGAPVIVMVHGYRFAPSDPAHDPFRTILSTRRGAAGKRSVPWPRHLGFGRGDPGEGLALAFGWEARGAFWRAHAEAPTAGLALARVIEEVRAALPRRPVHVVAHSLGARVALAAMRALPMGALDRVILMAPAEHRGPARAAMASPCGRGAEVVCVRPAENLAIDAAIQLLVPRPDLTLGMGGLPGLGRWLDLDPCDPRMRALARRLGHRIAGDRVRVCHHSSFARPGLLRLYRAILRERLPLAALRVERPGLAWPGDGGMVSPA